MFCLETLRCLHLWKGDSCTSFACHKLKPCNKCKRVGYRDAQVAWLACNSSSGLGSASYHWRLLIFSRVGLRDFAVFQHRQTKRLVVNGLELELAWGGEGQFGGVCDCCLQCTLHTAYFINVCFGSPMSLMCMCCPVALALSCNKETNTHKHVCIMYLFSRISTIGPNEHSMCETCPNNSWLRRPHALHAFSMCKSLRFTPAAT